VAGGALVLTLALAIASHALAQSSPPTAPQRQQWSPSKLFTTWDKNGDRKLTPDEVPKPELFKMLDRNGDGSVTEEEVATMGKGGAAPGGARGMGQALLTDLGEVLGELSPRRDRVWCERLPRHAAERRLQFVLREKGQHHLAWRSGMPGPVRPGRVPMWYRILSRNPRLVSNLAYLTGTSSPTISNSFKAFVVVAGPGRNT